MTQYISPYKRFLHAQVPNWLLERKELSAGAKLCYARLAQHADKRTHCWPGQDCLAEELGVSVRQIHRYLSELQAHELIEAKTRGMGRTQAYWFQEHEWMSGRPDGYVRSDQTDMSDRRDQRRDPSSEDFSSHEEKSSSSSEEEEDFLNRVASFYSYRLADSPHYTSAIPAPGPYFRKLRQNGDSLPVSDLDACWEFAEAIHAAVNIGYPDHKIVTFPGPASLPGLAACWGPHAATRLPPKLLRLALYRFCEGDGVDPPELRGSDVLERIAKRPDLFAEALRQQSEALG